MDANAGVNPKLPTWDGDWRTFTDYQLACQLESDGLRDEDRPTLAPRLARNLTAKAWEACRDIDRSELRKEKGPGLPAGVPQEETRWTCWERPLDDSFSPLRPCAERRRT